jgi:hypothetical protein
VREKRKLHNEQKAKAKLKAQLDHCKGVSILDPNGPKVPVDHKAEFEKELRGFMKDTHKRLALSTKATIFGKMLQGREFMDGILFKEAIIIIRQFYHDTVFANYKVLTAMDEHGGTTLNYAAVELLRDLERKYWTSCGVF